MLEKVELLKKTDQWKKDGGKFIPYPSTWLNGEGWEDEIQIEQPASDYEKFEAPEWMKEGIDKSFGLPPRKENK